MRKIIIILAFFFILIANCTTYNIPHYKVYADSAFKENHRIDIFNALEEWDNKTNNVIQYDLQFVDYTKLKNTNEDYDTIYIYAADPGALYLGYTTWSTKNNSAYMYIAPGIMDDERFTAVLLHELGHAFHLEHYFEPNLSIMHPTIYDDTWHVECTDLIAFCKEWGCTIDCDIIQDQVSTSSQMSLIYTEVPDTSCMLLSQ